MRRTGVTTEEVRARLLDSAVKLVLRAHAQDQPGERDPLAVLKVRDICKPADLSTGAFYSQWPNGMDDFLPEFARALLGTSGPHEADRLALDRASKRIKGPVNDVLERVASRDIEMMRK